MKLKKLRFTLADIALTCSLIFAAGLVNATCAQTPGSVHISSKPATPSKSITISVLPVNGLTASNSRVVTISIPGGTQTQQFKAVLNGKTISSMFQAAQCGEEEAVWLVLKTSESSRSAPPRRPVEPQSLAD